MAEGGVNVRYGPRKLGQKEFESQQAKKVMTSPSGVVYGKRKGGGAPEAPAEPENGADTLTLDELRDQLEADPSTLDAALEREFAEGSPRKGAIELFRRVENDREGGPRESVLELLAQDEG